MAVYSKTTSSSSICNSSLRESCSSIRTYDQDCSVKTSFLFKPYYLAMSDSEAEVSSPPKKKVRSRNCVFNSEWLKQPEFKSWLAIDNNVNFARCIVCMSSFSVKFDGVNAVRRHAAGEKHKNRTQASYISKSVASFFTTKGTVLEDKVTSVEVTKVFHTVKHGLSYNSSDCGAKLDRGIYVDSELAPKIQLGRTKMEAIVKNVLSPYAVESVTAKLRNQNLPFSIATDALNKGNRKFFPLAIRFFDVDGVHDHLLDLYEEADESSESIKDTLIEALEKLGLDIQNVVAYGADNASVNYGKNCSVYQKLMQINPKIVKANCNAHVLHNAAKNSLKKLSYDVETLVLKVFSEFSCSAKKVAAFKECFEYAQEEYSQVLRHIPIRWLSLHNALERLLKNWNAIKAYFLQEGENNCERTIWSFVQKQNQGDERSERLTLPECYIHFVHHFLTIFQTAIKTLEKSSLEAPELFEIMLRVKNQFENRKNKDFFGFHVKQALPHLTPSEASQFKTEARDAYERVIEYLQKWFDYDNSIFRKFGALKLNGVLPTLDNIVGISSHLGVQIDGDAVFDELSSLQQVSTTLMADDGMRSSEKWCAFFKKVEAPNLKKVLQIVFAIPCSNAYVERIFSIMNSLWTEERNRLSPEMVKAELCVRLNLHLSCSDFHKSVKNNLQLLRAARSSKKYSFEKQQKEAQ